MPRGITPEGEAKLRELGLAPEQLPRHVAIIMDGNGRWAQSRGLPRVLGHRRGIKSVRAAVEESVRLGFDQLTLYALSVENWKRPAREIRFLMRLLRHFLVVERKELMEQNVRLVQVGRRDGLPPEALEELDKTVALTAKNDGLTLALALNYGGRDEIVRAARRIAEEVAAGRLSLDDLDEAAFSDRLDTAGMPDPDLMIRTAGELRVSNFLLWQISYAELYVTETLWPDFREAELHQALVAFASRRRKFGGLPSSGAERALAGI